MWQMSTQCHWPSMRGKSVTDAERNSFFVLIPTTRAPSGRKKASSPVPPLVSRLHKHQLLCIIQISLGYPPHIPLSQYECICVCVYVRVRTCMYTQSDVYPNILNSRDYTCGHFLPEKLYELRSSYQWLWSNGCFKFKNSYDVSHNNFMLTAIHTGMQENVRTLNVYDYFLKFWRT